jgi:hypothetical protein
LVISIAVCILFETWASLYQANIFAYEYESIYGKLPHFGCLDNAMGIFTIFIRMMFPFMFAGMAWKSLGLPTNSFVLVALMIIFTGREFYLFHRLKSPQPIKPQTK